MAEVEARVVEAVVRAAAAERATVRVVAGCGHGAGQAVHALMQ